MQAVKAVEKDAIDIEGDIRTLKVSIKDKTNRKANNKASKNSNPNTRNRRLTRHKMPKNNNKISPIKGIIRVKRIRANSKA